MWLKRDLALLAAVVLSSAYHVWVKRYAQGMDSSQFTFVTNLVCFGAFALVSAFDTGGKVPDHHLGFWAAAVAFGMLGTGMTYMFWNKALAQIEANKAGFFMNLVPLSAAMVSVYRGEAITKVHLISALLISLGIVWAMFKDRILAKIGKI